MNGKHSLKQSARVWLPSKPTRRGVLPIFGLLAHSLDVLRYNQRQRGVQLATQFLRRGLMFFCWLVGAQKFGRNLMGIANARSLTLVVLLAACCLCAFAARQDSSSSMVLHGPSLVRLRVVVRDANGNPVTGLTQNDFRLLDDKKPRQISFFSADAPPNSQPYYVLGFIPDATERDGKSHAPKVELVNHPSHYTIQVRVGDFAPRQSENASAPASEKDQLTRAIFNPQPAGAAPVEFHAQFAKMEEDRTQITVVVGVDLHSFQFHKEGADNVDDLHSMIGIFDVHGNYVAGQEKNITLRLTGPQLRQMTATGATFSVILDAKPGDYQFRVALMDSGSQQLQFSSQALNVP
jgi:hypothetical protein